MDQFTIKNSNIVGNKFGLTNFEGITSKSTNNYWGDSSGPYHPSQNTAGKGDSVSASANIDPWLTKPNTDAPPIPPQNLRVDYSGLEPVISWDESKMEDFKNFELYVRLDSDSIPDYTHIPNI